MWGIQIFNKVKMSEKKKASHEKSKKEIHLVGKIDKKGNVIFDLKKEYNSYGDGLDAIETMPNGIYHVQKFYSTEK